MSITSSSLSSVTSQMAGDAVAMSALKKALNTQAQGVAALVNGLPQPAKNTSPNLPSHLGQNINTTA